MQKLDIRSVIQPFSFLIISKAFKEINEGETLEITLSGENAVSDLLKILPPSAYTLLGMESVETDDSVRIQLRKTSMREGGIGTSRTAKPI